MRASPAVPREESVMGRPPLPTGTDYDLLLPSLRLERPWATPREGQDHATAPTAGGPPTVTLPLGDSAAGPSDCPGGDNPWTSITGLIARRCHQHAAAAALADGQAVLPYGELAHQVAGLAGALAGHGVGAGDVICLVLDRGMDFVRVALAAWWLGAAYVPLSPDHPADWRTEVARRCGAAISVGRGPAAGVAPGYLDLSRDLAGAAPALSPMPLRPADLAYVIPTSGSTGEPKLVMIEHGGVRNLVRAQADYLDDLGPGSRVLQFAHPSFDSALFEVLLALAHGGRLELIEASQTSGEPLATVLRERRVTHAVLPAAVLRTLEPGLSSDLRVVLSVGDVCLPQTARQWSAHHRFINGYGPTEVTVAATLHSCTGGNDEADMVPIGRPITGCQLWILDDQLRPVPAGQVGEICLGGAGVGRGYLGQPDATARRFVTDPFTAAPGARLYRTGDLGRLRADGAVEFLGRQDAQVKIRGARIELGQVEAALAALPGVRDAVAVADASPGEPERRLLGYVRKDPAADPQLPGRELRQLLTRQVPGYLVPEQIVTVAQWPLTTSGKVDRARLPRPPRVVGPAAEAPRTPTERAVTEIAVALLGTPGLGVHDNLFDVGGHSLLAAQLVARIRDRLGRRIELSAVLNHPTIAGIAGELDARPGSAGTVAPPTRAPRGTAPAASYAQQRVWLMHKLNAAARAYNSQAVLRLSGELDRSALNASLSDLVRRHAVLRSRFPETDGELRVEIDPPWPVEVDTRDLTGHPEGERAALVGAAVRDLVSRPFDLPADRPFRWLLLRTGLREHVFAHVEHHIIHDGWTFNLFVRELVEGYVDYQRRGVVRRPDLAVQYYDYARWQRDWCTGPEGAEHRSFWRDALADADTVLRLPRRGVPDRREFRGEAPRLEIDAALAGRLASLSARAGCSLFVTLLSAYFVLLHRYTGQADLLVGSAVANRRWRDTEQVLGMFVNTVVLRGKLDGDPTFTELLDRVRRMSLSAFDHSELPFEMVLEASAATRQPGVNPLIQTMFSFHDSQLGPLSAAPFGLTLIEGLSNGSVKFDLEVIVVPRYDEPGHIGRQPGAVLRVPRSDGPVTGSPASSLRGITLAWQFDSDVLDPAFVEGMLDAFRELLAGAVADPDRPVSRLTLLDEQAARRLVRRGPAVPAPSEWLPDLVLDWAQRAPDAPAVSSGRRTLSYRQLIDQASALARRLRAAGTGQGDVVAICLPSSAEMVVAQLGAVLAGAAYLPLEPGHPDSRLSLLIADSRAVAVVTTAVQAGRFADVPTVLTDDLDRSEGDHAAVMSLPARRGDDLAYVIYTSGSTGAPKGVQVDHGALAARLYGLPTIQLGPGDRMLAIASPAFDVSVLEIWAPLISGAEVHLPEPGWDLTTLAALIAERRLSHALMSATVLHQLVRHVPGALDGMRQVLAGADVLSPAVVRTLQARGVTGLVNTYGPTEAVVFATAVPLLAWSEREMPAIPIGAAVSNTHLVVVDDQLRPVPDGAVGEICIGGAGLARGYLNDPVLTRLRFVPDPFAAGAAGRLYRTGDLGRWLPGDVLEFLGRKDEQVKIRGVRVEPGEVRAALTRLPGVTDALVLADGENPDGRRLIGYALPAPGADLDGPSLRRALGRLLPGQLVPDVITLVDNWPLTSSGKIDRGRLPRPSPRSGSAYTAPRSADEERLAEVAADLLGVDRVGVHDNFFELGMHSLLGMKLAVRASAVLHREIGLATVLTHPTVAALAMAAQEQPPSGPPIGRLPRTGPLGSAGLARADPHGDGWDRDRQRTGRR
jgi:amino acid adenylation domain-containing protein